MKGNIILMENLGRELKNMRTLEGMTQQQLADKAGVHVTTIINIERENFVPEFSTIRKIVDVFGFDKYELIHALWDKEKTLAGSIPKRKKSF
jgi:DNA-binding XRE family transcriptional regulator